MRRVKVRLVKERNEHKGFCGIASQLVDVESGEPIGRIRDFTINVPLNGVLTVNAELLIDDIEVVDLPLKLHKTPEDTNGE